ncbi:hypothetical protein N0B44_01615 [Roseibacterium beibuensis]|uniref:EF-hand domain-containing protein n=1 Tax=[Roseibacterium] beibuensis TaxID=1193142 RepID=A0ABP9KZV4_9RHOB|nr:hypothetical protein [Roseibacterium beibuensis]MCS6621600.1 hypothetical protein [Roseibacterium beibuensis]
MTEMLLTPRRGSTLAVLTGAFTALIVGAGLAMGQAESLDADGDGMVSYEEVLAAMPEMTEEEFAALDADGDGMLSAEEIATAEEAGLIPAG